MQTKSSPIRKSLVITASLAVALLVGVLNLTGPSNQSAAAEAVPAQVYTLGGRVYEGVTSTEPPNSTPI